MLSTRRDFLTRLLGLVVAASGAAAGGEPGKRDSTPAGATPAGTVARSQRFLLERFKVAGFRYYEGMRLIADLQVGDALILRPEPTNAYDRRAVEVLWRGHKLGYVPRQRNAVIRRLLKQGAPLQSRIRALRVDGKPWEMVEAEVSL